MFVMFYFKQVPSISLFVFITNFTNCAVFQLYRAWHIHVSTQTICSRLDMYETEINNVCSSDLRQERSRISTAYNQNVILYQHFYRLYIDLFPMTQCGFFAFVQATARSARSKPIMTQIISFAIAVQ